MTQNIKIEYIPVETLNPATYNPRTMSPQEMEKLKKGIGKFGFVDPAVVNKDMTIIGGHQRVKAAIAMGFEKVPCVVLDINKVQEKQLNLALNKISGEWVDSMLADILRDILETGADIDLTGFDQKEIDEILGIKDEKQLGPEDPGIEPVPDPFVQPGDLWACGPHLLLVGDSTNQEDINRLMGREKADLVWTDPPYNVNYESKAGKIQNDHMGDSAFFQFLVDIFTPMKNALKPGGCFYIAHADSEGRNFRNAVQAVGLQLRQNIVWVKNSPTLSRSDYNWKHEPILYGWKEGGPHYFNGDFTQTTVIDDDIDVSKLDKKGLQKMITELRNAIPTSVIRADKPAKSDLHPTQKPVYLVEKNILASSKTGEIVLDICGGSGTTMIACRKHGRRARLMELDPKYAQAIIQRYMDYCGEEPELIHPDEARQPMHAVKRERKG